MIAFPDQSTLHSRTPSSPTGNETVFAFYLAISVCLRLYPFLLGLATLPLALDVGSGGGTGQPWSKNKDGVSAILGLSVVLPYVGGRLSGFGGTRLVIHPVPNARTWTSAALLQPAYLIVLFISTSSESRLISGARRGSMRGRLNTLLGTPR